MHVPFDWICDTVGLGVHQVVHPQRIRRDGLI